MRLVQPAKPAISPNCEGGFFNSVNCGLTNLLSEYLVTFIPFVESKFLDEGDGFVYAGEQAIAGVKGPTLRVGLAGVDDVLDGVLVERVFLIEIAGHC